ncbi:DUF6785 family protein [Candidatus Poribacteria bacterium]
MDKKIHGVTWRSLLLGSLLIPVNAYWLIVMEVRFFSLQGSNLPLFVEPVFILFLLTLLNLLFSSYSKSALTRGELLTIYIMLVISTSLNGEDYLQNLFGVIGHSTRFATPENEWQEMFFRYIPKWLVISDKNALMGLYEGESSIYTIQNLRVWFVPLAAWGSFVFCMIFLLLCINIILRRRWAEGEKLAFPIVQLPLAMTAAKGRSFFSNRIMWLGFAIAATIDILNGLNTFIPSMPHVAVSVWAPVNRIHRFFTDKPWDAIGRTSIGFYPFAIGLGFLLPLDLSFSCWFFYVLGKAVRVFGSVAGIRVGGVGWNTWPVFPYFNEQASGAWVGLAFVALLATRKHLKQVLITAFARNSDIDDSNEPMSYRLAVSGAVLAFLGVLFFCRYAGMSIWAAALFFWLYIMISIGMTRIRAEMGTPHLMCFSSAQDTSIAIAGTRRFSPSSLTVLALLHWFNRCARCSPMSSQLEAFKMSESAGMRHRKLAIAVILAIVIGILSSFWANLALLYKDGASVGTRGFKGWVGWESFNFLKKWLTNRTDTNFPAIMFMILGFGLTIFFTIMRRNFFWWPLHPAGYVLTVSHTMQDFWFVFFVGWSIKLLILKGGGLTAHRKALPFFLGLILGDFVLGSIWGLIGWATGIRTYAIFY